MTSPSPTDSAPATSEEQPPSRGQWVRGVLGPLAGAGILVALLWPHLGKIGEAIKLVSWQALAALAALHLLALLLRAEAWGRSTAAAGAPLEPRLLHSTSALRFLADTIVPTYLGAWVRIALVKRLHRPTPARPTPTVGQMITADGLMLAVEAVITVGLVTAAVLTSSLEWWWIAAFAGAVLLLGLILRLVFTRFSDREFAKTVRVLKDPRQRLILTALLTVVLTVQPLRYFIALHAVGLDPTVSEALLAFLLTTVFNALPIGPGPSSVAAAAALFSSAAIERTASAGLVLLATAVIAAAVYSIYGTIDVVGRFRRLRVGSPEADATQTTSN